jgi:carbohydrate diacid regulator
MVSNQMIKDTLFRIREISGSEFNVYTMDGVLISPGGIRKNDDVKNVLKFLSDKEVQEFDGKYYFRVNDGNRLEYILSCASGKENMVLGQMAVMQLEALIAAHQERFDKDNFIKNLLLDNLLPVDIYNRAKKLHIDTRSRRVAFLIETRKKDDTNALETVRLMFSESDNDFITPIDESNIILVKELKGSETEENLFEIAQEMADHLNTEAMSQIRIAFGNVADEIRKVSNSYKEAKLALSVGKIFTPEQNVISYASLGIGRLIYQLPLPMCRMFIEEIFHGDSPENYDEETLATINQFFDNNLNVSETSRQLYIHRNTLVYRLDKLQKMTGLDLRVFDDAITFKIALMVVKYMHYMETQE